jgi:dipeptidyl-peptidase-4
MAAATASAETAPPVLDIERLFASPDLNGPAPRAVAISPDSSRVTFLKGKASDRLQMDLWEYHVDDDAVRLLVDSAALVEGAETLSEAEQARRERLRIVDQKGIVSYQFSPDGGSLLFPLSGDLFLYRLESGAVRQLTDTEAGETDPSFSSTGSHVSFIRDQDLFVIDLDSGSERQLTTDGEGLISNGMAEFIAQEEMDRYTGYWWSPDDRFIAYLQVDESPVEVVQRFEIFAKEFRVYDQRYPATGTPNATVRLGVLSVADGTTRWMDVGENTDIYIPRVDWFPDSRHLAVQRQSRDQQTLELLKIDITTGAAATLLTETSDTWINLHNELRFLDDSPRFLWASARSGYKHLYLYRNDGELIRPLTEGSWEVVHGARGQSAVLYVDEERDRVYVTGTYDSPLERHVYAVPLERTGPPRRLSRESGWHRATFADNGGFYVNTFENTSTPPRVSVHRPDGSRLAYIEENRLSDSHPYAPYLATRPGARFGTLKARDGQVLHYRLKTPADFRENRRYPVIVHVYGGPGGQSVTRTWSAGFLDVLASNGYLVFTLDNRGTGDRGTAFDAPIYRRLGQVEVQDQVAGADYLRSLPYVDGDRIGVYGWSYGGYLALMCMFQSPDTFAAGVAGAPVTDWALYDTHYTERYMGTPADNPDGYAAAGVFPYIERLKGPLLVMHGMADDNVLFTHSTKLFKALQDKGLNFDSMTYPGSKHALLRVPASGRHGYQTILRFFDTHLGPAPEPQD